MVTAFAVNHGELIKPAYGYRIDYKGRSILISGDTKYDENIVKAGQGVDVVIHEVAAVAEGLLQQNPRMVPIFDHHTNPEQAGKIFAQIKPKLAIYTHIIISSTPTFPVTKYDVIQQTRKNYGGPLLVGSDLMTIVIDDSVAVYRND